jgi:hypothetical protein
MKLLEVEFPEINIWCLYTPYLNTKIHYFYEKLGYGKYWQNPIYRKTPTFYV